MSETISIKDVIDDFYSLGLSQKYVQHTNRIVLSLDLIFANKGLKTVSGYPEKLKLRYSRITDKLKKFRQKPKYHGFDNLEDIFYSASEFPGLCANETVPKR